MYMLVLQTFLLMLAAFLVGCMCACLVKRSLYRVAAGDPAEEYMQVSVPPAVPRSAEPAAAQRAPAPPVAPGETQRFERALAGDVAAATTVGATSPTGPVIEVQAPPPAPSTASTARSNVEDTRQDVTSGLAAAAAAAAAASVAAMQTSRRSDEVADEPSYVAVSDTTGDATGDAAGDTYNAIAVASHDGSTLSPAVVHEATLPAPQMPEPAPLPQPVPPVDVPQADRPNDAPDGPDPSYVAETLAAGIAYAPPAPVDEAEYELPAVTEDFSLPPDGATYASIATGGVVTAAPAAAPADESEPTTAYETKPTHAATAVAASAAIAAERAFGTSSAEGGDDLSRIEGGDDLTRIDGVDDVIAARLNYAGISRFQQIASWNADDVRRMSQALGFFGRIEDEYWIGQAKLLAEGGDDAQPALADDTPPTVAHATPAGAADIATAAAAAAAAALASRTTTPREVPRSEDAAQDTGFDEFEPDALATAEPSFEPSQDTATNSEAGFDEFDAPAPADEQQDETEALGSDDTRPDLAGLRSVRSEGLRGDDAEYARSGLDDLKRIRGIGVLIEKKLNSLGIGSYEQVANWSSSDIERISELLDFKGRIERENWIEQARILASGGQTEFSRRVDRGEV